MWDHYQRHQNNMSNLSTLLMKTSIQRCSTLKFFDADFKHVLFSSDKTDWIRMIATLQS